jgi:hypothetical protein
LWIPGKIKRGTEASWYERLAIQIFEEAYTSRQLQDLLALVSNFRAAQSEWQLSEAVTTEPQCQLFAKRDVPLPGGMGSDYG